jgi:hypothetical protein
MHDAPAAAAVGAHAPWSDHFERTVAKRSIERKNTVLLDNEQLSLGSLTPPAAVRVPL